MALAENTAVPVGWTLPNKRLLHTTVVIPIQPARAGQGLRRLVVRNTSIQLIAQGAALVGSIATNALLGRALGPTLFGQYNLAFAYVGLVTGVFANWGLGTIAVRDANRNLEETEPILGTAIMLQAGASLVSYTVLLFVAHFLIGGPEGLIVSIVGITLLFMPLDLLGLVLQIRLRLVRGAFVTVTGSSSMFLAVVIVVRARPQFATIVLILVAASLLRYLPLLVVSLGLLDWSRLHAQRSYMHSLLQSSWPLGVEAIATIIISQMPTIILGRLSTSEQIGYFSAANKILGQFAVFPIIVSNSLFPIFSRFFSSDVVVFRRWLCRSLRYMVILAAPIPVVGWLFGGRLAIALFGPGFAAASAAIAALSAQAAILFPGIVAGYALIARGKQRTNLVLSTGGGATVILACFLLVPTLGAVGAAMATMLAQGAIFLAEITFLREDLADLLRVSSLARLGVCILSLMVPASSFVVTQSMLSLVLAVAFYIAALFLTKSIEIWDLHAIVRYVKRSRS